LTLLTLVIVDLIHELKIKKKLTDFFLPNIRK